MSYIEKYDTPDPIREVHAMNAMVIWEAVLERSRDDHNRNDDDSFYQWFTMGEGVWEGRQYALTLAFPFEVAYDTISDDYSEAFDWEFIPSMLHLMFANHSSPFDKVDQDALNHYAQVILQESKS